LGEFAEQINERLVRFRVLWVKAWDSVAEILPRGKNATDGWRYDTMMIVMNLAIATTAGGRFVLEAQMEATSSTLRKSANVNPLCKPECCSDR